MSLRPWPAQRTCPELPTLEKKADPGKHSLSKSGAWYFYLEELENTSLIPLLSPLWYVNFCSRPDESEEMGMLIRTNVSTVLSKTNSLFL